MWLITSCELSFQIAVPTPFVLMLRPRIGAHQWVAREEYRLEPSVPAFELANTGYGYLAGMIARSNVDNGDGLPKTTETDAPCSAQQIQRPRLCCAPREITS